MTDLAFHWIVVIMLCLSNFQTFISACALLCIYKNTEWGRNVSTQVMTGGEEDGTKG